MNKETQEKDKFQLDRLAFFSDAIFAIAITILIIEIKVPEPHEGALSDTDLGNGLLSILPKFIGFLISFFVIGLYWQAHHRMFRYVTHSNQKLLKNNLLFMLPIVIMPFSTSFLSEYYNGALRLPLAVYMVNICLTGYFSYRLWDIIGNPKNHLGVNLDPIMLRYNKTRAMTIPILFLLIFILSFFNKWVAYFIPPFLPVASYFIKARYVKKYPEVMRKHLD